MNQLYIKKRDINLFGVLSIIVIASYAITAFFTKGMNNASKFDIYALGYLIDALFVFSLVIFKKVENNKFSLISLLLIINFTFNFGQISLWTLGIHAVNEIGTGNLYSNFPRPTDFQIFQGELYSFKCFCMLILGLSITTFLNKNHYQNRQKYDPEIIRNIIYKISIIVGIIIIPLTFVKIVITIIQSAKFGYLSLYYSDFSIASIISRSEDYFFPVIVGLLIGSNYKKIKPVYIIFALYTVLYIVAGERGNWVYKLLILFWMHTRYYKPIKWKSFFKILLIGIVADYNLGIVVDTRSYGLSNITGQQVRDSLTSSNPLTRFIFEMGNSLGITIIVLTIGRQPFAQLGNTYLSAFLASFSSKLADLFNINYVYLASYLTSNILKTGYGTGFTFFAETYVNTGNFGYFLMILFGIVGGLVLKDSNDPSLKDPFRVYLACISCAICCSMVRDSALGGFRQFVQVVLFMYIVIRIFYDLYYRRSRQ